ncbi:MAG TPA: hypothetical protein VEU52_09255 [Candidatus Limnocylindrales bacterium]|jgi:hypothetical protein|nr:hypothetical protein [Candidatus Limnocylindrales bacterium]
MPEIPGMRLGKKPARHDPRTLQFAKYLLPKALPAPPAHETWAAKVNQWPMMGNDKIGDCTCAAAGHFIEEWTANVGPTVIPPDQSIIAAYSAITGYDPATGANDNGAVELDVLNYWRSTGIDNHKIEAYVALEPKNTEHIKDAVYLFGGVYIGVALPVTAQNQTVWSVPPGGPNGQGAPGSWGGHAVPVVAYDNRTLTCVTWGKLLKMTWGFWQAYCDEAYAILSPDWINSKNYSPGNFDLTTLRADLNQVVGVVAPAAGATAGGGRR